MSEFQQELFKVVALTGGGGAMLITFTFFTVRKWQEHLYFLFVLVVTVLITQYYAYFYVSEYRFVWPWLAYVWVAANFNFGPALCYYFFSTLNPDFRITWVKLLGFAPTFGMLVALPLVGWLAPELVPADPKHYFRGGSLTWLVVALYAACLYNFLYYLVIFTNYREVFTFRSLKTEASARGFLSLFVYVFVINGYAVVGLLLQEIVHIYICSVLITGSVIAFYVFSQEHPEFVLELESAVEKARYKKSKLTGVDLKDLHLRLIEVMNNDRLYLDESLTLAKAAKKLDLTPHQLSEFMNRHLKVNFSTFVNQFRIEKAKRILIEEDANILSVAFKVGFNSKANFNLSFKSMIGLSPREFVRLYKDKYEQKT